MKKELEILKKYGATDIKDYYIVNNYGFTFKIDGKKYDLRFWANCYGVYIGKWQCDHKEIEKEFNENIGDR